MSTDRAKLDSAFLPSVASILSRLQRTTEARGNHMLAYLIDLARAEAEEQMRCDLQDAMFRSEVLTTSSTHTWRAGTNAADFPAVDFSGPDMSDPTFAELHSEAAEPAGSERDRASPAQAEAA